MRCGHRHHGIFPEFKCGSFQPFFVEILLGPLLGDDELLLQSVRAFSNILSVLQCVAVRCNVLQYDGTLPTTRRSRVGVSHCGIQVYKCIFVCTTLKGTQSYICTKE